MIGDLDKVVLPLGMNRKILTIKDLPPDGFLLIPKDAKSIQKIQNLFYEGVSKNSVASIATGLEHFTNRIMLFLGQELDVLFSFEDHNQPKKLAIEIGSRFDDSTVQEVFEDGWKDLQAIWAKYHVLSVGKSLTRERKANEEWDDTWRDEALDDFEKLWKHFNTWFANDLFLKYETWNFRKNHPILEPLWVTDSTEEKIKEKLNSLEPEYLDQLSPDSIIDSVTKIIENEEYDKAKLFLRTFEDKFEQTNDLMFRSCHIKADISLLQRDYNAALEEYESALLHTEKYGKWDYRYTITFGKILEIKALLKLPVEEDLRDTFLQRSFLLSEKNMSTAHIFMTIEKLVNNDFDDITQFENHLKEIITNPSEIILSPKEQINIFVYIDSVMESFPLPELDTSEFRKIILKVILEIAEKYSRWNTMINTYSKLIAIEKIGNDNLFKIESYEKKKASASHELERVNNFATKSKRGFSSIDISGALEQLKEYFTHCVQEKHTEAIEILSELSYSGLRLAKKGSYESLDEFNGPSKTLMRLIRYAKYLRMENSKALDFIDKFNECAIEGGGWFNESIVLDTLLKRKFVGYISKEKRIEYVNRLIKLNKDMGSQKFALIQTNKKADLLYSMDKKEEAMVLYNEVFQEFLEIEPINSFYLYNNFVRKNMMFIRNSKEVLTFCQILEQKLADKSYNNFELNKLQALAMISDGSPDSLTKAKKHLQETFDRVIAKPYVNQKNLTRYEGIISTYITINLLSKGVLEQKLIEQIDKHEYYSISRCIFFASKILPQFSNLEEDVAIKLMYEMAELLIKNFKPKTGYALINSISRHYSNLNNDTASDNVLKYFFNTDVVINAPFYTLNAIKHFSNKLVLLNLIDNEDFKQALEDAPSSVPKAELLVRVGFLLENNALHYHNQALHVAEEIMAPARIKCFILYHIAKQTKETEDIVNAIKINIKSGNHQTLNKLIYIIRDIDEIDLSFELISDLIKAYSSEVLREFDYRVWIRGYIAIKVLTSKFGRDKPDIQRSTLQLFSSNIEKSYRDDLKSFDRKFLFHLARDHINVLRTMGASETPDEWECMYKNTLLWISRLNKVKGVFPTKLYVDLWEIVKLFLQSHQSKTTDICSHFVNHLQLNEAELDDYWTTNSWIYKAEIQNYEFNDDAFINTMSDIVKEWERVLRFSEMGILHYLKLIKNRLEGDSENKQLLFSLFCRAHELHVKSQNKNGNVENLCAEIIVTNSKFILRDFNEKEVLSNYSHLTRKFIYKILLRPINVYSVLNDSKFSQDLFSNIFSLSIKVGNINQFLNEYISYVIDLDITNDEKLNHLYNWYFKSPHIPIPKEKKRRYKVVIFELKKQLSIKLNHLISGSESLSDDEKLTKKVGLELGLFSIKKSQKSSFDKLIQFIVNEKRILDNERTDYYIKFLGQIINKREMLQHLRMKLDSTEKLFSNLQTLARIAHGKNKLDLANKLYISILISERCTHHKKLVTTYRMACLCDFDVGNSKMMNIIAERVNEGLNAKYERLLYCIYLIKNNKDESLIQRIAQAALNSSNILYFVGKEVKLTKNGVVIGNEEYRCSSELLNQLSDETNIQLNAYRKGFNTGNDVLFAILDEGGLISSFDHFGGEPHVNIRE